MPKVTQQSGGKQQSNGSVLSKAIDIADMDEDFLKLLIYGQNRTGKTTLACQGKKPLLLVALEPNKTGGAKSVKRIPGVQFIKINSTRDALKLAEELEKDKEIKTVVVDSATSYQDIVLMELLDLDKVPEQLNWGLVSRDQYRQRSEKTREALRPFLNLNKDVIVCAKERDHNPPDKDKPEILRGQQLESFFAADLGGATVGWLHDACDYIGRLYLEKETIERKIKLNIAGKVTESIQREETGRIVRRFRTMYHPNFAAGFRSENPESVPEYIEADTPEEMYNRISKVIRGEKLKIGGYYPAQTATT